MISATQALELGWQSFQQGDLAGAEQYALYLTSTHADVDDGWFLRGLIEHMRGHLAAAMSFYEHTCALNPNHIGPLNNLGLIYAAFDRHHDALDAYAKLLNVKPDDPLGNGNRANSLAALGRIEEAHLHYRRALAHSPDHFDALLNYGAMLINQSQSEEALPYSRRALALQPHAAQVHNNLGLAYLNLKRDAEAGPHLHEALRLDPASFEAMTNLGNMFARQKSFATAVAYHRQAVRIRPQSAMAHDNLGLSLQESGHYDEALGCFRRAIELRPDFAAPHANLGKALADLCRFDEAKGHLHEAIRLKPDHANAHNVLGLILYHCGEDEACERCFAEALRHDPKLDRARLNRAFLRLRQGDFARGLPDYELRFATDRRDVAPCSAPRWDGGDLTGRTILVRSEQGRGDDLQFLRYLPLLSAKGARVIGEFPACMHPIAARVQGIDAIHALGELGGPLPPVDVQVSIMSLPYVLGSIDAPVPYLHADPILIERWEQELRSIDGFKIAIAWQGDPSFRVDPLRSVPLAHFEPLARIPGVRLISVQKHVGLEQIDANRERVPVVDFGDRLDEAAGPFMDTAAIMKCVDLVVTSDTAIAHLAGGLGVPTWLAVHDAPDWRWFLKRDDSPWYPSMRLFRQTEPGDWTGVFARLASAVGAELARRDAHDAASELGLRSAFFVPTSPGELLDKFSILQIKSERLTNAAQIRNVRNEIRLLERQRDQLLAGSANLNDFVDQLKNVNETLWQVEEDLRSCERANDFGPRFIELARSVYKHNDQRAAIKRTINLSLGSPLTEEKAYEPSSDH